MAGAAPQEHTGKGGKKALDAELNLVPFIDLLSCCISFLLITAVWTQLDCIQARGAGSGGEESLEPGLTLVVDQSGYRVRAGQDVAMIPRREGRYDVVALRARLAD